jgi:hypothetical protein
MEAICYRKWRVAHICLPTNSGAPYLDFEMWVRRMPMYGTFLSAPA